MSSDKKNIDELFKEKLANNSVPYNDSYWENAQHAFKQFEAAEIASNSTMAIKTVVALAQKAFIMVGLIGFLLAIGSDFNKSSLSATKYEETTTTSSVLASSQKNDK